MKNLNTVSTYGIEVNELEIIHIEIKNIEAYQKPVASRKARKRHLKYRNIPRHRMVA